MHPTQDDTSATERFAAFAEETRPTSALYAHLANALAARPDAAALLDEAPLAQRRATLMFAAVHELLLTGREQGPLCAYYPSLGGTRAPDEGATAAFLDVVARHRPVVVDRLQQRSTQTNEPGRTIGQRAAIAWLHARDPDPARRLALVEVGTSAGLLLHLDRYRHALIAEGRAARDADGDRPARAAWSREPAGDEPAVAGADTASPGLGGAAAPEVVLDVEVIGRPPPMRVPGVVRRIGIDRAPLRVDVDDDRDWLRACVWPEHVERLARLDAALTLARSVDDVELVAGAMLERLEPTIERLGAEAQVVVLHSATLAYQSPEDRHAFERVLDRIGATRPLWRIGLEGHFLAPFAALVEQRLGSPDTNDPGFVIAATRWSGTTGEREDLGLGRMQPHGRWIAFAPPS